MHSPRFGLGFRSVHHEEILAAPRAVDWLEVLSDNFLAAGGARRAMLERLRGEYPLALHGVSLSIAGADPPSDEYLRGLRELAGWLEPVHVSDHLCWTALRGHQSHDLLPVAYTREVLDFVAGRVARVQDALGRRLVLENATAYVAFRDDELAEAAFFAELCRRTGCGMLLDVNNLYVNAHNLGADPEPWLDALPADAVAYMHLAGHAVLPDVRIDTHDADVPSPVWDLFEVAARRFPHADVIVERDDAIPPFASLAREVAWARERHAKALAQAPPAGAGRAAARAARTAAAAGPAEPGAPERWRALQRGFWERLVDKPVGFDHRPDAGLPELLDDGRPVAAARGMSVYSDAYAANLRRALETNLPALARVLSPRDFGALAGAYLRAHPPKGHDYVGLGAALPTFLRSHAFAQDYGVAREALSELAALEQAQLEVQEAPDAPGALAPGDLAAIPPEAWAEARFAFVPALRLVHATHDVLPVTEAVARGESPERPARLPVVYAVHRVNGRVRSERLTPDDAAVLGVLRRGGTFGEACAALDGDDDPHTVQAAARVLVDACARGWVAALRSLDEPGRGAGA
jgi:hypothetical protein